jgi:hypothetical protein
MTILQTRIKQAAKLYVHALTVGLIQDNAYHFSAYSIYLTKLKS